VAWEGRGTRVARGFAALRMQTNRLKCWAEVPIRADGRYVTEPVQLLCRALRLTPPCYRRFELTAAQPQEWLDIQAEVSVYAEDDTIMPHRTTAKSSYPVGELAAAMRRRGVAEDLDVVLSRHNTIVVCKTAQDTLCGAS